MTLDNSILDRISSSRFETGDICIVTKLEEPNSYASRHAAYYGFLFTVSRDYSFGDVATDTFGADAPFLDVKGILPLRPVEWVPRDMEDIVCIKEHKQGTTHWDLLDSVKSSKTWYNNFKVIKENWAPKELITLEVRNLLTGVEVPVVSQPEDCCRSCGSIGVIQGMACICPECGAVIWGC